MYAQVVLPLPLQQAFTYSIPADLAPSIRPGMRVLVPFGSRRISGVVVELSDQSEDVESVKAIDDLLDDEPSFTVEMLALTSWIADYYVCGWGEAVRAALPPGLTDRRVGVKLERYVRFSPAFRHPSAVEELRSSLPGQRQIRVVECLAGCVAEGQHEPRQADLLARAGATSSTLSTLKKRGIVEVVEREVTRHAIRSRQQSARISLSQLHQAQTAALEAIYDAIEADAFRTFLLYGVTGSGKTEVYIEALKRVLERGKSGIILVPEISLTPQTVRRFEAHFGGGIAVLHSRMSLGERFDAWRGLRDGRLRIAIGPRSAVLAPLADIGLIVVDEEHDASYKQQDPAPRYHARDVAVMRAHRNGAVCILGSATPSLESYMNARSGKYQLLEMPDRVPVVGAVRASLPNVQVVDLTLERKKHRLDGALSEPLRAAIAARLNRGEQTILLQNRRGYSPALECADCGWSPQCPDCSVSMTVHKKGSHLRCHYCGRTARIPELCPNCGSRTLERLGVGTQRVEEELSGVYPNASFIRMDLDTTTGKNAHSKLLDRFERGEADILMGTQMVSKGLDFARVTLVGIVNADTGLLMPDFRAEERTFQLLAQVAGRAGRAELPGEVVIQTRNPKHPVIRFAMEHDYRGFAEEALADRRERSYPPFGRMAAVEFRGPDEVRTIALARKWTDILRSQGVEGLEVLGPESAFITRVRRDFRFHTILKSKKGGEVSQLQMVLCRAGEAFGSLPRGIRVNIDVDPVGLF